MKDKETRLSVIQDMLLKQDVVTVKEFAKEIGTSDMTIRRDLALLEDMGIVKIFYGGVSLNSSLNTELKKHVYDIEQEVVEKASQKMRIAKKAASFIQPNDVILIDTGSTTLSIIEFIPDDSKNIVYSYALDIIKGVCAKPNLSVVACGGYFHRNTRMFESEEGAALIEKTRINRAFMAARGVTAEVGVTTAESYEISIKKAALTASEQKILLADSSKMGKAWYAKYAQLEEFDIVITDSDVEDKYVKMIEQMGVEVCIV